MNADTAVGRLATRRALGANPTYGWFVGFAGLLYMAVSGGAIMLTVASPLLLSEFNVTAPSPRLVLAVAIILMVLPVVINIISIQVAARVNNVAVPSRKYPAPGPAHLHELFGDQLRDPDRRFELHLALRVRQLAGSTVGSRGPRLVRPHRTRSRRQAVSPELVGQPPLRTLGVPGPHGAGAWLPVPAARPHPPVLRSRGYAARNCVRRGNVARDCLQRGTRNRTPHQSHQTLPALQCGSFRAMRDARSLSWVSTPRIPGGRYPRC